MDRLVPGGVYRHYRGEYYLVLFVARIVGQPVKQDADVLVYMSANDVDVDVDGKPCILAIDPAGVETDACLEKTLFKARAHADINVGNVGIEVAVYVPLYTHKPGRRISVRPVADFFEAIEDDRCGGSFRHDYTLKIPGREIEPVEYGDGIQRCRSCSKKQPFNFNGGSRTYNRFTYVGTEIPR